MIAEGPERLNALRKSDVDHFANRSPDQPELLRVFRTTVNNLFPVARAAGDTTAGAWDADLSAGDPARRTASTRCSTSRSATTSSAGGSAWPATACRSTPTCQGRRRLRPRPRPGPDPRRRRRPGRRGDPPRPGRRGLARRRRRQPLDHRRGGRQGGQPVRDAPRPSIGASSKSTWPRPARPPAGTGQKSPTSSPPAT